MSASSLQVITVDIPSPSYTTDQTATRINSTVSFTYLLSTSIRTLSTNGASQNLGGLLYTPVLSDASCENATLALLPANVTRLENLPQNGQGLSIVALAPWTSPNCVLEYLHDTRPDVFIFYLPGNEESTTEPPDMNDPVWGLGDGGSWKRANHFPVYAVPGATAQTLLDASAQYSGNMTEVPYGHRLTESFDSRDYVRLLIDIDTGFGGGPASTLPSLWVFLLVVLGILLAIIGLTSAVMHGIQHRRRQALRRRVANGEVDLEALGIKRLTVPQSLLEKMPLYTYGTGAPVAGTTSSAIAKLTGKSAVTATENSKIDSPASSRPSSPISNPRPKAAIRTGSYRPSPLQQPTCAICLDDFVVASTTITPTKSTDPSAPSPSTSTENTSTAAGTTVRELPCHHIFHPDCIDTFLLSTSSLCPMCKKSCLPKGYCPKNVTNAMVRRERVVRGIRPELAGVEGGGAATGTGWQGRSERQWRQRLWDTRWRDLSMGVLPMRRVTGRGATAATVAGGTEMVTPTSTTPAPVPASSPSVPEVSAPSSPLVTTATTVPPPIDPAVADLESSTSAGIACPAPQLMAPPPANVTGTRRREWARQRATAMLAGGAGRQETAVLDADEANAPETGRRGWRKVVRGIFPRGA